jgi:hypothetical protein
MTKIELRNVKHAAFASEETPCFEAAVYIDGQKAGTVSNDGHGGSCMYHPWAMHDRIEAFAKTLPAEVTEYDDPQDRSRKLVFQPDADTVIMRALDEFLLSRDLKRDLTKRVIFVSRDGTLRQTRTFKRDEMIRLLSDPDKLQAKLESTAILNLLSFDAALAIYREKVGPK